MSEAAAETGTRSYAIGSAIYLRLLAAIYFVAFVSLWVQIDGLIGSGGILPAADFFRLVGERLGVERYTYFPSLCWLSSSDAFLHVLCGAGATVAAAAVILPLWAAPWPILWALYLSLFVAGQTFLGFQWDILLLEAGFLAVLLAPARLTPGRGIVHTPRRIAVELHAWLLFRLLFASGVVKITWNDPSWQLNDLTALTFHYETQCLPPWTAWYMHHLPAAFHRASCAALFAIEIGGSLLLLVPGRARRIGCFLQAILQVTIAVTGNYGFFNYLTLALCVPLLDDAGWPRRIRQRMLEKNGAPRLPARRWPAWLAGSFGGIVGLASIPVFVGNLAPDPAAWLGPLSRAWEVSYQVAEPFHRLHVVSSYGLFRSMTKDRPEIVVEGSDDGTEWKAYEFKYKPGDLSRRPAFVAPHQPRLDWQMWFAALSSPLHDRWFSSFVHRLLEGSQPVLGLLAKDPFEGKAPRYVRALRYDYHFTSPEEGRSTGNWWKRTPRDVYLRPVSLASFERH